MEGFIAILLRYRLVWKSVMVLVLNVAWQAAIG
jgi:hypothetical protein